MFDALRHREYRLLWIGLVCSNVGGWMQMVALGWLVYSLTDSPFWLGLVGFVRAIPALTFTLWGGVLADRVDRRRMMLVCDGSIACLALILALLVHTGAINVYLVLVMAFLTASAWAFEVPARQSLVPDLVPRADMINAIGLQSAAFNGAGVFGPTLAAVVIERVGIDGAFAANGVLTLGVVVALLLMRPVRRGGGSGGALSNLIEGFRFVCQAPALAALFGMVAVSNLAARPFIQLMPAFAGGVLQAGPSGLGLMMGLIGAGGLVGAFLVANFGSFRRRGLMLVLSGLVFCSLLIGFSLSQNLALSAALCFGMGCAQNFFYASTNTMIQTNSPGGLRGRLMSMYAFMMMGFMPLGSMALGSASEAIGVQPTVALGGLLSLGCVLLLAIRVPQVRALE